MLKSFTVSAAFVAGANAFWRMECPGSVGTARMDPIVNPGEVSGHAHSIFGSSGFSEVSQTKELLDGDCTSCRVTQDKSSYWHPAVMFEDADTGKFEAVNNVGGMLAYYLLYGENVTAFPSNFQMISGTSTRRSYTVGDPSKPDPEKSLWASMGQTKQEDLAQRAIGFNCLNYAKTPEGTLYRHYLPDKAYLDEHCTDGVRFELMFPSCWKGGDHTDSPNHKDHVAFPDLVMTGTCPDDYPVRLPSLLFEVIWDTYAFKNRNGRFVIANGDTTGYGYHGDFIMGWEEEFLQDAVNTCTNPSGQIEDCPLFNIVDKGKAQECKMKVPKALVHENVVGPMKNLPGDVKITFADGSDETDGDDKPVSSVKDVPTLTYAAGDKPSETGKPLPGNVFKESAAKVAAPSSNFAAKEVVNEATAAPAPPATTPAPEAAAAEDADSYFSTQYVTDGHMVSKILWEEKFVTVTEIADAAPSSPAKRGHAGAHLHGRGHRHH